MKPDEYDNFLEGTKFIAQEQMRLSDALLGIPSKVAHFTLNIISLIEKSKSLYENQS